MSLTYSQRRAGFKRGVAAQKRWDAEAKTVRTVIQAADAAELADRITAREVADRAAPCNIESLKVGDFVRVSRTWHEVARVSAKSVSVVTGYSWTDRIAHGKIVETRCAS